MLGLRDVGILLVAAALCPFLAVANAADRRLNQDLTALPQGEVTIVVNPQDPQHLVASWIDWDGNRGQGVTTFHARSVDGGATWQTAPTVAPGVSTVWPRVDPALAFDGQGRVYEMFVTTDPEHAAWVLRSSDGGLTFDHAVSLTPIPADKSWIAVDPANDNVYATWTNADFFEPLGVLFSRSTDGGDTFSAPVYLSSGGGTSMVAVGPDGQVYVVYVTTDIVLDRSLDGGATWLATDILVTDFVAAPNPVGNGLRNPMIPTIAVDRTAGTYRGRIYVVWTDARDGDSDAYLVWSGDQGDSWSAPVRVNDDAPGVGTDQVMPWLWVDDAGHVHVQFLDRREDPDNVRFSVYMATSTDGGDTFGPNIRISDPDLPQGGLPGRPNQWVGDYNGGAGAGGADHVVWSDGRNGDMDVFYRSLDDADFDEDGVPNDGNADGQFSNAPCTGGQTLGCDDNCPGTVNPDQADGDGDGVGDACDKCPDTPDADRLDRDRDGLGDACDPCPDAAGRPAGDPDGDEVPECTDNCPGTSNPGQTDGDGDGVGDACDDCPGDADNDIDADGACGDVDNCPSVWNRVQRDGDEDGVGDLCDVCPATPDPGQEDSDGDARGDACDCDAPDSNDLAPPRVERLRSFRAGSTAHFGFIGRGVGGPGSLPDPGRGFDAYSVTRGLISSLGSGGSLGTCFVQGLDRGFEDPSVPPAGDGYFYLVQGQSFECGLGSLGVDSGETPRSNGDPGACTGHPFTDVFAESETTVVGTVTGTLADTYASDDVYESIQEARVGSEGQMEHRYTFTVPAGGLIEVHAEAFWLQAPELEAPVLEYSTDGVSFSRVSGPWRVTEDPDVDVPTTVPPGTVGTVILRWIDAERGSAEFFLDRISVDALWIRSIP